MNGKDKCKILKEIRREIAKENDIQWIVSECKHQGNCAGTCPKCEAEVAALERELERRRSLGMTVKVAGLSVAMLAALTGCTDIEHGFMQPTGGDVPYMETDTSEYELAGDVADTECIKESDCETESVIEIELEGDVWMEPESGYE